MAEAGREEEERGEEEEAGQDQRETEAETREEEGREENRGPERILCLRPLIPAPRSGHVCVALDESILVWGGYMSRDSGDEYLHSAVIWKYDISTKTWVKMETTGDVPMSTSGSQGCIVDNFLYVFAGYGLFGNNNILRRLNLSTLQWDRVGEHSSFRPSPRDKYVMWTFSGSIYVFGGFGHEYNFSVEDGEFDEDLGLRWWPRRGWTNQLLQFDTETLEWRIARYQGRRPEPRAAHAAALFQEDVFVFGGRNSQGRHNDLHRFHLPSQTWSGELEVGGEVPCQRSWHSLTAVSPSHAVLYGGLSNDDQALGDAWLLDTQSVQWSRLSHLPQNSPRLWHTAVSSLQGDLLVFGGCANNILDINVPAHCKRIRDMSGQISPLVHTNTMLCFRVTPNALSRLALERVWECRQTLEPFWQMLPEMLLQQLRQFQIQSRNRIPSLGS